MSNGLALSSLVNVSVNLQPPAAQGINFNTLLIVGSSNVIDVFERIRSYTSLSQVATDFGTSAPEYLAAALYFEQSPQPSQLYIGRWAQTATSGLLLGGPLTVAQQTITNWNNITNGGINFVIDGTARNLAGLDFSATSNMNGVASVINTALSTNGSCIWNGTEFVVSSSTTGAGTKAAGTITFTATNPTPTTDTITVNGTLITFVSGTPSGSQVKIGTTSTDTAANLAAFLTASVDVNISLMTYSRNGLVITATAIVSGTAGNAYTLVKSSTQISVSGATLTGGAAASTVSAATTGAGTDISAQTKLTASTYTYTVAGIAAETAVNGIITLDNLNTSWYALQCVSASLQNSDLLAIAGYIQGAAMPHIYGITTSSAAAVTSTDSTSIGYQLKQLGYFRAFAQYSSTTPHAVASEFGRVLTTNFLANNTCITLMYKQEPGVLPEYLTPSQAAALNANNYNYFAEFNNNTAIIVNGTVANGNYIDTIIGTDWLANYIQTNLYNLLYQTPTKIPQTDPGVHILVNNIEASCAQGVTNGLLAPGIWTATGFGTLNQGDLLSKGFYVYAPPVASQSPSARSARQSPVIQVAAKLAGAVHTVDVLVNVVN